MGAGGEALPLAVEYMQVWFLGLPFFSIAMVGSQLMRSAGDVKKPGYLMVVGAALQILCGPIFIFGLGGAPELGLLGAAVGFVVARFFGFLLYIYYIYVDRLIVGQLKGFCHILQGYISCRLAGNCLQPHRSVVVQHNYPLDRGARDCFCGWF